MTKASGMETSTIGCVHGTQITPGVQPQEQDDEERDNQEASGEVDLQRPGILFEIQVGWDVDKEENKHSRDQNKGYLYEESEPPTPAGCIVEEAPNTPPSIAPELDSH